MFDTFDSIVMLKSEKRDFFKRGIFVFVVVNKFVDFHSKQGWQIFLTGNGAEDALVIKYKT